MYPAVSRGPAMAVAENLLAAVYLPKMTLPVNRYLSALKLLIKGRDPGVLTILQLSVERRTPG